MVSPATGVAATRSAADSNLRCCEEERFRLQNATTLRLQRFRISGVKLGNRCKVKPVYNLLRASILDFRLRLGNRCKETLKNSPKAASILDFKPRLGNRCKDFPKTTSCVHRFLISGPNLGIDAAPSLLHKRMTRLQRSRGVQAGAECHEGGIILSKKPPEWRLSLPQPSHSYNAPRPILIIVAAKANGKGVGSGLDAGIAGEADA